MQIFLKNESNKSIIINIDQHIYTLIPQEGKYAETEECTVKLSVTADERYRTQAIKGRLGLSYFHRFIVTADYTVTPKNNSTVRFYAETAHGNNLESYTRIYPFCSDCVFSAPFYTVNNEQTVRENIAKSDKNEVIILQGAGLAGKLFKAKNTFDDIITALILGAIALVVFVLLWVFKDFKTAAMIYGGGAVFTFLMWKLILERLFKKIKAKAKNKAEKKVEKIFLPCNNMPEGIFKSKDSYFSNDYITAVFNNSTKRI